MISRIFITSIFLLASAAMASAQAQFFSSASTPDPVATVVGAAAEEIPDSIKYAPRTIEELHAYLDTIDTSGYDRTWSDRVLPREFFMPAVFDEYEFPDTATVLTPFPELDAAPWLAEELMVRDRMKRMKDYLFYTYPERVPYNVNLLPEAPKRYHAVVDPQAHTIEIREIESVADAATTIQAAEVKKRHWIRTFNVDIHFSQAYVSPNWYQGGNSNLNALGNIYYNVKLNPKYHPNLLFETTAQYKLGINSTPEDEVRDFNISDDLLQINTTLGIKAAKRWYYSFTAQFKTQLFNSYDVVDGTNDAGEPAKVKQIRSSFLSPSELTAGIGMTYNYANAKKTVTFDASIAPISYSLRTCINKDINPERYNIEAGHRCSHNFGSSAELKFFWQICYNISFRSRFFAFTDYKSIQADWENTLSFTINRFLSTQIYAHARYDTKTPKCEDAKWKKLQIKEILSIGFTYKFSSI